MLRPIFVEAISFYTPALTCLYHTKACIASAKFCTSSCYIRTSAERDQTPHNAVSDPGLQCFTLENLCTRTAQSSRGGHSRRVGKIACLCAPCR